MEKLGKELPAVGFCCITDDEKYRSTQCAEVFQKVCKQVPENKAKAVVGVIGYPGMGKRSVLAILKAFAGKETNKEMVNKIQLEGNTGVTFAASSPDAIMVRNVPAPEDLSDPYVPVRALIKRLDKHELLMAYEIADFGNTQEFLASVAVKAKLMLKGGVPDYDGAARMIIHDWIQGKIPYYEEAYAKDDDTKEKKPLAKVDEEDVEMEDKEEKKEKKDEKKKAKIPAKANAKNKGKKEMKKMKKAKKEKKEKKGKKAVTEEDDE